MISQTGGHGDFRLPTELPAAPGSFHFTERIGAAAIADDADAVRRRAREQLAQGASQLKLMAGGGVASSYDPLDVTQYTVPELRAAVEAAENWGTYVTVHAYTPRAVTPWPESSRSRPRGAPTCSSARRTRPGRARCSPRWCAGTPRRRS